MQKKIRNGIELVPVARQLGEIALENVMHWLGKKRFQPYRNAILSIVERGDWELLVDSFYRMLPFGTGGRRGAVGVGPNRMNPYTVTTSVQGHCTHLKQLHSGEALKVVLAADVRCFLDLRNQYDKESLGILYGLTSRDFSVMAAEVYAANGVDVIMADPGIETYVSTPELSFLIYRLGAHGGLNMSASHNHPDDNGAKFYNGAGGQVVPPEDQQLIEIASTVTEAVTVPFQEAVGSGRVRFLTDEERNGYLEENLRLSLTPSSRSARIAFSPLHGTGRTTALPILRRAGFSVFVTESQAEFDGAFPSAPFRIPNPEVPSAMDAVIATGRQHDCDIAMATDPDGDRLGVAIPDQEGRWHCLTGNQTGLLMADHVLSEKEKTGELRPTNYLVKTEVTSNLLNRLADAYGVRVLGHLLVGFKYIGDVLDCVARTGRWGDFEAAESDFLMGMEESLGVLASPVIRDKDAANGALWLAELAARCREDGISVHQRLRSLYKRHGYFGTGLRSVVMEGAVGLADIRRLQADLRASPPERIGGRKVLDFADRQDESGVFGKAKSETDFLSRDVLVYRLEGGVRLTLRPSGTEPKNKTYAEMSLEPLGVDAGDDALDEDMGRVNRELNHLLNLWEVEMLARLGIDYPYYATLFSDSLSLAKKREFVTTVEPELRGLATVADQEAAARAEGLMAAIGPLEMLLGGLAEMTLNWDEHEREGFSRLLQLVEEGRAGSSIAPGD